MKETENLQMEQKDVWLLDSVEIVMFLGRFDIVSLRERECVSRSRISNN